VKFSPLKDRTGALLLRVGLVLSIVILPFLLAYAVVPSWWSSRGVLVENISADDYAPVNQGQLKNIARAAAAEMDDKLPGGAGDSVHALVGNWLAGDSQANDFAPVNVGQLKKAAAPFYDRLSEAGLPGSYPWADSVMLPDDFAVANGQLKGLFSFELPDALYDGDHNGLPDAWEQQYFGTTGVDPNGDADGDGIVNLQEYLQGTDPTDYYNGTLTSLTITGGGDQRDEPGTRLATPILVKVNSYGVQNAPITFSVAQGGARLLADNSGGETPVTSLTTHCDAYDNDGFPVARAYVILSSVPGDVSVVRASTKGAGSPISIFTTAVAVDDSLGSPTGLIITPTSVSTAELGWIPNGTTSTTVQATIDGGQTWLTLGVVGSGVAKITVTGLPADHPVGFRLFSGGTPTDGGSGTLVLPASSESQTLPPPGSGGGPSTPQTNVTTLSKPIIEEDEIEYFRFKGGFPDLLRHVRNGYRTKTQTLTSDYKEDPTSGSTTTTSNWVFNGSDSGGFEVETKTVVGGGGVLFPPITTVSSTETLFKQVGLTGANGGSSFTMTVSNFYADTAFFADSSALVPDFMNEFYETDELVEAVLSQDSFEYYILKAQYRFKVNADPNLVVQWDVQFTPAGPNPAVQHKVFVWKTNGATQSPIVELDPRKLNAGAVGSYRVVLLSADLAVDGNRDGIMNFSDSGIRDADRTTADKPYRFWLNDDDDTEPRYDSVGIPLGPSEAEKIPPGHADSSLHQIVSKRNLEDFTRLWIDLSSMLGALTNGGQNLTDTVQIGLKWKNVSGGAPAINIYPSFDGKGSSGYLSDDTAAQLQLTDVFGNAVGGKNQKNTVDTTGVFIFKSDYWGGTDWQQNPKKCFLFEGVTEGKGELTVVFLDHNDKEIAEGGSVCLDVKDIKKMYQRVIATPDVLNPLPYASTSSTFDETTLGYSIDRLVEFESPFEEDPQCLIFVHGWRMTSEDSTAFAETMFKRLWWQGYKGRFVGLRWGTQTSFDSYNTSEWLAWKYGKSLKDYVDSYLRKKLPLYAINIAAHSMGNVVTGSALQRGMKLNTYILMEAAIPSGSYNDSVNSYPKFLQAELSGRTPDTVAQGGYRLFLQSAAQNVGDFVSFFNIDDYALATGTTPIPGAFFGVSFGWPFPTNWEQNQLDYKPNRFNAQNSLFGDYRFQPDRPEGEQNTLNWGAQLGGGYSTSRIVNDIHESMAFVARPRSKAAGAELHNATVFGSAVNLEATCGFGADFSDHGGQFMRSIQDLTPFYSRMVSELKQ